MNTSTTGLAAPTEAPTATPTETLATSVSTSDSSVPSEPRNVALGPSNNSADLTVTPPNPNPDVTNHLVKTGTAANLNAANAASPTLLSTMGHKSRKAVLYITSFFVPPLAVYLRHGTDKRFGLSVLLTLLGWIPGVLYAMYHVSK